MSTAIQFKRGSRSLLDAHAKKGGLVVGEPLLIQDEERMGVALSPTTYVSFARAQELSDIVNDDILHPHEKPEVVQEVGVLHSESAALIFRATEYAITTEKAAYASSLEALSAYLSALPGWDTVPGANVTINGGIFRSAFQNVYVARGTLRERVAEEATLALAVAEIPHNLTELNSAEGTKLGAISYGATRNIARGPWQTGEAYTDGDSATFSGSSWTAGVAHTSSLSNQPPASPNLTSATWVLTAERGVSYDLSVQSTNGTTFRVGTGNSTAISARLFANGVEVTDQTPSTAFQWTRVSMDPRGAPYDDASWNAAHASGYKSFVVSLDDVYAKATFTCQINL